MTQRSKGTTLVLYVVGLVYGLMILVPLAWVVMVSVKTQLDAFAYPPLFIFRPTVEHYAAIFQDETFVHAIRNSLIIACGSVFLSLLLAIPATYAIANLTGHAASRFSPYCVIGMRRHGLSAALFCRLQPSQIAGHPYWADHHLSDLQCAADYLDAAAGVEGHTPRAGGSGRYRRR